MAEQNNQAERAAPEPLPMYADAVAIVKEQQRASVSLVQRRLRISWNEASDLVETMLARQDVPIEWAPPAYQLRAALPALPAAVDAEGLPPLPSAQSWRYRLRDKTECPPENWYVTVDPNWEKWAKRTDNAWHVEPLYTAEQVQQIIAADRRKQAALTQMIELGQEIEASDKKPSIVIDGRTYTGDEIKGRILELMADLENADQLVKNAAAEIEQARMDGRTAGAAVPEGWKHVPIAPTTEMEGNGLEALLARGADANSGDVEACWNSMIDAAPSHQSPGKEGA